MIVLAGCTGDDETEPTTETTTTEPTSEPAPPACLHPRSPAERPDDGWLSDDRAGPHPGTDVEVVEDSEGLAGFAGTVSAELPEGFAVTTRRAYVRDGCDTYWIVAAEHGSGSSITVHRQQLAGPAFLFETPLGHGQRRTTTEDGEDVLLDDFYGDGTRVTAIVVTEDGLLTRVTAMGANSPSLAGWPTTTAVLPGEAPPPPPGPAPLTLEEAEALARSI